MLVAYIPHLPSYIFVASPQREMTAFAQKALQICLQPAALAYMLDFQHGPEDSMIQEQPFDLLAVCFPLSPIHIP